MTHDSLTLIFDVENYFDISIPTGSGEDPNCSGLQPPIHMQIRILDHFISSGHHQLKLKVMGILNLIKNADEQFVVK
jgi:hypothetical protein